VVPGGALSHSPLPLSLEPGPGTEETVISNRLDMSEIEDARSEASASCSRHLLLAFNAH
jgi:hypothetical protein